MLTMPRMYQLFSNTRAVDEKNIKASTALYKNTRIPEIVA